MDQQNSTKYHYYVDVVMCIDATRSMTPFLKEAKKEALKFYPDLCEAMERQGMTVDQVRVKVIAFRDFGESDFPAMKESKFFTMPQDDDLFHTFLAAIQPLGGGDDPENSLEAIALALKSDWTTEGDKRRHVIVVFTDDAALPLNARVASDQYTNYFEGRGRLPIDDDNKELSELNSWWHGYSQGLDSTYEPHSGRMVIFAPEDKWPWRIIGGWNRVWPVYSKAGHGLKEIEMAPVIDLIAHTIQEEDVDDEED